MKTETLSIDLLRLDGDTQSRIEVNSETLDEYADVIAESNGTWPFSPLVVFHDGSSYFVADGFHRTLAALNVGRASVPCEVKKGSARDARIFGMTANDKHGLRISREDRRLNVVWLLEKYPTLTHQEVANKSGAGLRTVKRVSSELNGNGNTVPMAPHVPKTLEKQTEIPPADVGESSPEPARVARDKVVPTLNEQQVLNRKAAQNLIDAAVRAVDDLNHVKKTPQLSAKQFAALENMVRSLKDGTLQNAAVRLLQGVELW